jgi:hypothetical protein
MPGKAFVPGATYRFYDFVGTPQYATAYVDVEKVTFIGCRFQSNSVRYFNAYVIDGAQNVTFSYCGFTPLISIVMAPPHADWPSAGAGLGINSRP